MQRTQLQLTRELLREVAIASAHHRGTAAGQPGWTVEITASIWTRLNGHNGPLSV